MAKTRANRKPDSSRRVRYAIVGAGHIAQDAVLPAFANARRNSTLAAIVSDDPRKRSRLSRMYKLEHAFGYDEFDAACASGCFDAVYIALPNSLHCDFTCRAVAAGMHVLCEKPLAVRPEECVAMIDAASERNVTLMTAYRLHFEEANLRAMEIARTGKLGELRLFDSVFSMQIRPGNVRLKAAMGGGPLGDLGVYCINAARYAFRDEPLEVTAFSARGNDDRFTEVEEAVTAVLRFPGERLAQFTCSFGAADQSFFRIVGTKGDLRVEPSFGYHDVFKHRLTINGKSTEKSFRKVDHFAAELLYFSDCILNNTPPEPGAVEGLIDVRIIQAIHESIASGGAIRMATQPYDPKPTLKQTNRRPPSKKKPLVRAKSPHAD